MRLSIFISLAVATFLSTVRVHAAAQVSDGYLLRKASLHIRGVLPSNAEYADLKRLQNQEERNRFLRDKIDSYLGSPESQDRLVFSLSERFQVLTPEMSSATYNNLSEYRQKNISSKGLRLDSMSDLFARMSRDNLSWDYLLTGKDYNAYPYNDNGNGPDMTDLSFFRILFPNLPKDPGYTGNPDDKLPDNTATPLHFASDDQRVAGVLSTPRFLSRYNTTNTNKNRRRAAAVFRTFLCDPMFPIIPPPPDKKTAVLEEAFSDGDHIGATEARLTAAMTLTDAQRHGSDKKCMACHYKLDPMGKTFQNIGLVLSREPSKGALSFAHADGQVFSTKLGGLGDLGKELIKQPEYVSCQVEWFWKQYIGTDVVLEADRKKTLIAEFESVGRRTNDFIRVLVMSPEFRMRPVPAEKVVFTNVQPLLKRCDTCHASEFYIPTFADGKIDRRWLLKMRHHLNLPEGSKDKMPKDWMKWDAKDLSRVKNWIEQGAVDSSNQALLTPDDLKGAK